jgi:hypothetical protein
MAGSITLLLAGDAVCGGDVVGGGAVWARAVACDSDTATTTDANPRNPARTPLAPQCR